MTLLSASAPAPLSPVGTQVPPEVEFVISALEAGQYGGQTRRASQRHPYRVSASLKMFSDDPAAPPWTLFIRDIDSKGVGFVTRHRLPLGYGGILSIKAPHGRVIKIDCTLLRCREAAPGWFEGGMYFNREQVAFESQSMALVK